MLQRRVLLVRRVLGGPLGAVVATSATTALVLGARSLPNAVHVALMLVACTAYLFVVTRPEGRALSIRLLAIAVAVLTVVAVAAPPSATEDLWWYAIYGRILAVYHASPYTHVAADYGHDPLLRLVGHTWRHTPSVYGPVFSIVSGGAAWLFGPSQLATRWFYQGLAASALVAVCVVLWKRTRSADAVAYFALNPLTALYLVNGGRNDILVGLSLLATVVLIQRRHPVAAGVAGALGALVKLTGLVGVVALGVSLCARHATNEARRFLFAAGATVGGAYVVAGTAAALTPMHTAGARYSRASVWHVATTLGVGLPPTHVALVPIGVFVGWITWRSARAGPELAAPTALTALTLGAPYTLPGYTAWALPTAALRHRSRVARVVAAQSVLLMAAYEIVRHPFAGAMGLALRRTAAVGASAVALLLIVWLASSVLADRNAEPEMLATHAAGT
jgi:hypothetical protein